MTFQVEISCRTSRNISCQLTQGSQLYSKDWYIAYYCHSPGSLYPFMLQHCAKQVGKCHAESQKIHSWVSAKRFE